MKKFIDLEYLWIACMAMVTLVSCYDEDTFLEENITETGRSFPNIYMNEISDTYSPGESVLVELEFFSDETIDALRVYQVIDGGERQLVAAQPYQPAFSMIKSQDTLVMNYLVPDVSPGAEILLVAEIVNENKLTDESSRSFDVVNPVPNLTIANTLSAFDGMAIPGETLLYALVVNDTVVAPGDYQPVDRISVFSRISGQNEVQLDDIDLPANTTTTFLLLVSLSVDETAISGQTVTFRFEAVSSVGDIAITSSDPVDIVDDTPLVEVANGSVSMDDTDTLGYDLVNLAGVPTGGDDAIKDLVINELVSGSVSMSSRNDTKFVKSDLGTFDNGTLHAIGEEYLLNRDHAQQIIADPEVDDVYIAKVRGVSDYVIIKIASSAIFLDNATVEFVVKAGM